MINPSKGTLTIENIDPNKAIPLIRLALFNLSERGVMSEASELDARPLENGNGVKIYVRNKNVLARYYGIDSEEKLEKMFNRLLRKLGSEIERDVKDFIENVSADNGYTFEECAAELEKLLRDGDDDFDGWDRSTYEYGDEKAISAAIKSLAKPQVKSESIAYADLPWAEKQQNTVNEAKMQKLFPTKRLDEAMERLFEDAPEKREPAKFEEDYIKD